MKWRCSFSIHPARWGIVNACSDKSHLLCGAILAIMLAAVAGGQVGRSVMMGYCFHGTSRVLSRLTSVRVVLAYTGMFMWAGSFRNDELTRLKYRSPPNTHNIFHFLTVFFLRWPTSPPVLFIKAPTILIDLSRLQIKLSRPNAAYPLRWKTEGLTRIHLLQVLNGPPVPPAATYPSAGESSVGTTLVPMVVKTEQQL